ncbi:MAG: hypothetical protein U0R44_06160 [Candidatus Micrarchaeia archaeon]
MDDQSRHWAAGSYLLFILSGIAVYIIREKDGYDRFHAMQSMLLSVALFALSFAIGILGIVLSYIPFIKIVAGPAIALLSLAISLAALGVWLAMMWKAYNGERYRLPVIGDQAEKLISGK